MDLMFVPLANGKIYGSGDVCAEELLSFAADILTEYIAMWDVSRGVKDDVKAYITGLENDLSLHICCTGVMMDFCPLPLRQSPYYTAYRADYTSSIKHVYTQRSNKHRSIYFFRVSWYLFRFLLA